jgi:hypothetical protein
MGFDPRTYVQFGVFALVMFVINLLIYVLLTWACLSAGLSVFKSLKQDCEVTYTVEPLLSGNWFCPKKAN